MQVIAGLAVQNEGGQMAGGICAQQGLQDGGGAWVGQAAISGIELDIPKNLINHLAKYKKESG